MLIVLKVNYLNTLPVSVRMERGKHHSHNRLDIVNQ